MDKDPNLETVLQRIRETYSKQTSALEVPISVIEEKLKAYRQAAKSDLLAEFLERNGIPAGERRTESAALALYEAMHDLPEFKPVVVEVPDVPDDEPDAPPDAAVETPEPDPAWPTLKRLTPDKPLGIFGGYVLDDKLTWLEGLGVHADWTSNSGGSRASSAVGRVAAKIRNKNYSGIIVLNELIGHDESNAILAACRASGTLYAMGKKAGKGQLRLICDEFEKRLKEQTK